MNLLGFRTVTGVNLLGKMTKISMQTGVSVVNKILWNN